MKKLLIILLLYAIQILVHAQYRANRFDLKFKSGKFHVDYLPFSAVEVLDNRFDTALCIFETGELIPEDYPLNGSLPVHIKKCFKYASEHLTTGNRSLVLNVLEFRVANKYHILRRRQEDSSVSNFPQREYFCVFIEAFEVQQGGRYSKFLEIKKEYYKFPGVGVFESALKDVLYNIVEAVSFEKKHAHSKKLAYLNDSVHYKYFNDTVSYSFNQLNAGVRSHWAELPILNLDVYPSGYYQTFDDFKNNHITQALVEANPGEKDSTFTIALTEHGVDRRTKVWAASDGTNLYVRLQDTVFLKMNRIGNAFYFDVPRSLPNLFNILSVEQTYAEKHSNYAASGSSLIIDFASLILQDAMNEELTRGRAKRIAKRKSGDLYRHCFIDMECGDFVYL